MAQDSFAETLIMLFFKIPPSNFLPGNVLNSASIKNRQIELQKTISSISLTSYEGLINIRNSSVKTLTFTMLQSPLFNKKIDSGFIKIKIREDLSSSKLLNIEWCIQYKTKHEAEEMFDYLKKLFIPISSIYEIEELEDVKSAQFSTKNQNYKGVKDISIFLLYASDLNVYEIRILPINEFM